MSKKIITIGLIICLICLNLILLATLCTRQKELQQYSSNLEIMEDSLRHHILRFDNLLSNYLIMTEFQSMKIDRDLILYNTDGQIQELGKLVCQGPKLIFKYSKLNCDVCVDEQIILLKEFTEIIGSENVIIISDYDNPRELTQFVRMNQLDNEVPNLHDQEIIPFDKSLPYYFILSRHLTLQQLFIPLSGSRYLTKNYFNIILRSYFND